MARSFFSLCIINAICLTSLWILIALGIYVIKMQSDQDILDLFAGIEKEDIHSTRFNTEDGLYYLPSLCLTTISKSLIWLGFIMDSAVCFTEFMVVWLKVQAVPGHFYWISAARYLTYLMTTIYWYDLILETWQIITVQLVIWTLCRIFQASYMNCMNKQLSNEVDGINNPVAYAVGPTGNKAMAGA